MSDTQPERCVCGALMNSQDCQARAHLRGPQPTADTEHERAERAEEARDEFEEAYVAAHERAEGLQRIIDGYDRTSAETRAHEAEQRAEAAEATVAELTEALGVQTRRADHEDQCAVRSHKALHDHLATHEGTVSELGGWRRRARAAEATVERVRWLSDEWCGDSCSSGHQVPLVWAGDQLRAALADPAAGSAKVRPEEG